MNHLSNDDVMYIIQLAEKYYLSQQSTDTSSAEEILEKVKALLTNKNRIALRNKVYSLSSEEIAELQALMNLGTSSKGKSLDDWDDLYKDALASEHK